MLKNKRRMEIIDHMLPLFGLRRIAFTVAAQRWLLLFTTTNDRWPATPRPCTSIYLSSRTESKGATKNEGIGFSSLLTGSRHHRVYTYEKSQSTSSGLKGSSKIRTDCRSWELPIDVHHHQRKAQKGKRREELSLYRRDPWMYKSRLWMGVIKWSVRTRETQYKSRDSGGLCSCSRR